MTPSEAQAVFVAADEEFLAHARQCDVCGNSRLRYRPACAEGDPLRMTALAKRELWAQAVAEMRAAASSASCPDRP